MFGLCTYVGLRNAEVVHLKWGNFIRNVTPPELQVRYCAPDADDDTGWEPKTGERSVDLFWPEVVECLKTWHAETIHSRGAGDWIVVNPTTGKPYNELPHKWYKRLQRATGIEWTPQVGRRTACSIMPIHAERLTKMSWTVQMHEDYFGHSIKIAGQYYTDRSLSRVRKLELDLPATPGDVATVAEDADGFDIQTAKRLLDNLITRTKISRVVLGKKCGVSDVAIGKFLLGGASVPQWFWKAIRTLLDVPLI